MTHPKIAMFLRERDRASARGDNGIIRSMTFELRRLGVRDDATLAHPEGAPSRVKTDPSARPKNGKLPRCEHENVAERCEVCNPELAAH